jgi:hypothetical protein
VPGLYGALARDVHLFDEVPVPVAVQLLRTLSAKFAQFPFHALG